jgi:membrane protease subunit HflK
MAKKEENHELHKLSEPNSRTEEFDTAGKSLTDALEISFVILKIIMVILVIAFLASGFKTVNPDEKALVLRLGKIKGTGQARVLTNENSPYWIIPYPIDEMVKIPSERTYDLTIDSFWYYLSDNEKMLENPSAVKPNKPLHPIRDGYCLTRSEKREDSDAKGNDYNLVHTEWKIEYKIENPELFFTNVQIPDKKISDISQDIFEDALEPVMRNLLEDVVVTTMVKYTIDEAITSKSRIPAKVKEQLNNKLDVIDSGVLVKNVLLNKAEVPRQVKKAFDLSFEASQNRNTAITDAERKKTDKLNETAGPVAEKLYEALNDDTTSENELEALWAQLKGKAKEKLSDAEIYKTTVVSNAEASVNTLKKLLPEYKKNPDIVVSRRYYDMLKKIYENADEIMALNHKPGDSGSATWILLNRDTSLKSKDKENSKQD